MGPCQISAAAPGSGLIRLGNFLCSGSINKAAGQGCMHQSDGLHQIRTATSKMATGADGYYILNAHHVYCLLEPFETRIQQIDYFYRRFCGIPVGQTMESKLDIPSSSMISRSIFNPTVRRITKLQRKFRSRFSGQDFYDPSTGMIWCYHPSGVWHHKHTEWSRYQDPRTGCYWYHQASSGCALWLRSGPDSSRPIEQAKRSVHFWV